jgi:hypothetical protein
MKNRGGIAVNPLGSERGAGFQIVMEYLMS